MSEFDLDKALEDVDEAIEELESFPQAEGVRSELDIGSPSRWQIHPVGWVALGILVIAATYHTVLDTKYLIGNFAWWHWVFFGVVVALALRPIVLHHIRLAIEGTASVTKAIAWMLAWLVFGLQLFNVVTRYSNEFLEQDILFGQVVSAAWQSFGLMFLIGVNYGVRDGVNPRIDFWWANFKPKTKAWLDFVVHTALLLPFVWMAIRILRPYAETSLGRRRSGEWPSGHRVWETWEQSPEADQLPVGPIKAMLLVAFVLFGLQVIAEIIKTGFVMIGDDEHGDIVVSEVPQRIE
ncbi:MAG: TRAP transporter small permease subunit [Ilumatobacter sp.]|nr:TRAP transporter small permease subunit [Ilumatobacter sp.]